MRNSVLGLIGGVLLSGAPGTASANERHFTFTYETPTLPAGTAEIEPWTTWRVGREDYYSRFEHRLEFEVGLVDRLQTSLYVNFAATTADDAMNVRTSEFEYEGISSEWKLNLMDPVADPVGLALYAEVSLAPSEYELEGKVLLDKRIGDLLLAANVVFAHEWEVEPDETESEVELELDLAGGYFVSERLMIGIEVRNHTELPEGEFEHSAFFAGPTVAYGGESYWIALSVLPQIGAISGEEEEDPMAPEEESSDIRDLDEHEAVNARLLLGFHI